MSEQREMRRVQAQMEAASADEAPQCSGLETPLESCPLHRDKAAYGKPLLDDGLLDEMQKAHNRATSRRLDEMERNDRILKALDAIDSGFPTPLERHLVRAYVQVAMLRGDLREAPTADCRALAERVCDQLAKEAPVGVWPGLSREQALEIVTRVLWGNALGLGVVNEVWRAERDQARHRLEQLREELADARRDVKRWNEAALGYANELVALKGALDRGGYVLEGVTVVRRGARKGVVFSEAERELARAIDDLSAGGDGTSVVYALRAVLLGWSSE